MKNLFKRRNFVKYGPCITIIPSTIHYKKVSLLIFSIIVAVSLQAGTGIFGTYVTIGGTKYKSSDDYDGAEPALGASSLAHLMLTQIA